MRTLCIIYLAATTGAHLVAASPVGTRGARYIALHLVLGAEPSRNENRFLVDDIS